MMQLLTTLNTNLGVIVGIVTAFIALVTAFYKWIVKPIRDLLKLVKELDKDTADILCSQLTREHDYLMDKGCCPDADKRRIGQIYRRYKVRNRNHLADTFEADINRLPNKPTEGE